MVVRKETFPDRFEYWSLPNKTRSSAQDNEELGKLHLWSQLILLGFGREKSLLFESANGEGLSGVGSL